MSATAIRLILGKDLRLGPRSPIVLWALVVPFVLTLLVRGVFGSLFAGEPRLGVVDAGASALPEQLLAVDGIDVDVLTDAADLRARVGSGSLDAGVALPAGFDAALGAGQRPPLDLWVSGASAASARAVLTVAVIDVVRAAAGDVAPVSVEVVALGDAGLPLETRMLPLIVMMAVALAGGMVPAASLVEEKEHRTISALLVTPASTRDVLVAKGILGVVLAMAAGVVALLVNDAWGSAPVATLLALALGALMMAEIGLLLGCWARDTNTLFAAWKGGGILLFLPVIVFMWPGVPEWIARLGPTYYFLRPIFAVTVEGAAFTDVAGDLVIAAVLCLALVPLVGAGGRMLERRLAGTGGGRPEAGPAPPEDEPPEREPAGASAQGDQGLV
jgi:ABC-2 type transport system permease protein